MFIYTRPTVFPRVDKMHCHPQRGHFLYNTQVQQYKLKRCSNKECCNQCRYVMFKGTMTKWPVQKLTQGTTQKLL